MHLGQGMGSMGCELGFKSLNVLNEKNCINSLKYSNMNVLIIIDTNAVRVFHTVLAFHWTIKWI